MKITTAGDLLTLSTRWWGKQKIDNFLALRARSRTSRTVEFSSKNREKRLQATLTRARCKSVNAYEFVLLHFLYVKT